MSGIIYTILVQAVGVLGITASILSFQCKKHKRLLWLRTANEMLFALQYGMLGAYTGMMMNLIGSARNVVFAKMVEKGKNTNHMRFFFSALFLLFCFFTWAGFKSILVAVAKILSTVAYGSANVFFVRILIFVTSISWFIYNFFVHSYAGCVCEALTLCSIIIGIIRIDIPAMAKNVTGTQKARCEADRA